MNRIAVRSLRAFAPRGLLGFAVVALVGGACGDSSDAPPPAPPLAAGGSGTTTTSSAGGSGGGCDEPTCLGDAEQGGCDAELQIDSADGMDGARAIGLCREAADGGWGVIEAEFLRSDGEPLVGGDGGMFGDGTILEHGRGLLPEFGFVSPQEGGAMLALSTGSARDLDQPDFVDPIGNWKQNEPHAHPEGFPRPWPACPGLEVGEPYDSAMLRLRIRTPTDARSFRFDTDLFSYDFPENLCSFYNDYAVALLSPPPMAAPHGNVLFDDAGNDLSVNTTFLRVCEPCPAVSDNECPLGYTELIGTGFEVSHQTTPNVPSCDVPGSASTSWLRTEVPLEEPGEEITLELVIVDAGDGFFDSTILVDNFRFETGEAELGTRPLE